MRCVVAGLVGVFEFLWQGKGRKPRRRRRRMCLHCGRLLAFKTVRKYCSANCWRQRKSTGAADVVRGVHRLTNAERARKGRKRVRRDRLLDSIAQEHAADMAARGYFSHKGPGGITCTRRAVRAGYEHKWPPAGCVWIMDNIAFHAGDSLHRGTARTFLRSWLTSEGHRKNMLDGRHLRLGVGVAVGRRGKIYAVQAFS